MVRFKRTSAESGKKHIAVILSTRCEITWFNFDTVLKRFQALLHNFVWIIECIPQVISFQLLSLKLSACRSPWMLPQSLLAYHHFEALQFWIGNTIYYREKETQFFFCDNFTGVHSWYHGSCLHINWVHSGVL